MKTTDLQNRIKEFDQRADSTLAYLDLRVAHSLVK